MEGQPQSYVRRGLPFYAFLALTKQLEISPQHIRAVSQAVDLFGSLEKARDWLNAPNQALGCEIPLDLLDTEIGTHQVEEVLLRINVAIFS